MMVNGEQIPLLESMTLLELIRKYGFDPGGVAVERNGEIPDREKWAKIELKDGDRIELIRFVGGG